MNLFRRWFGGPPAAEGDPQRVADLERALDELRPFLAADGGDVDVVAVGEAGDVRLRWRGACRSCAARETTAGQGLEPLLSARLPWFRSLSFE